MLKAKINLAWNGVFSLKPGKGVCSLLYQSMMYNFFKFILLTVLLPGYFRQLILPGNVFLIVRKKNGSHNKTILPILLLLIALLMGMRSAPISMIHPGAGIVVDRKGQVYFADLSRGLIKIDPRGRITTIHKEGGHWLALDEIGSFSQIDFSRSRHYPRWFKRRTSAGSIPGLIADGGSPLVVGKDGNIYYVCNDHQMIPGGLQIARLSPDGQETLLNPALAEVSDKLGGIKGLAQGPDGSLYATFSKTILKINLDGRFTTYVDSVKVSPCLLNLPAVQAPYLRGLTVDSAGNIYVAATGCGSVIKITPDKQINTILTAEQPWAPSGLAIHNGDIYVLEHINPNSEEHETWLPRVRKLGKDGKLTTLFSLQ